MRQIWTDADFERMAWHDNHVHAIRCVEGENGEGVLVLDIDYILEWLKGDEGGLRFRVQPATLVFHGVMFPRIAIDYAAATAAFGPFMNDGIERRVESRRSETLAGLTRGVGQCMYEIISDRLLSGFCE